MKFLFIFIFLISIQTLVQAEEGITDNEIYIAQFGPLTGPASVWGAPLKGTGFLFDIINSEGGIFGRKIVYKIFNDGYNPAQTMSGVKQFQEKMGIFLWIGGVGTQTSLAVKDYLMNKKVIWFAPLTGSKELITPPNRYLFAGYPLYDFEAKVLCRYAIENLGKKNIAIVYQNDGYGKSGLEGLEEEIGKHKMTISLKIPISPIDTDMKDLCFKLFTAGSDTVLLYTTPFAALRLLKASYDINYYPQWMATSSFSDFAFLYKVSNGLCKNMITTQNCDFSDTQLFRKYKETFKKMYPNEIWTVFFHYGILISEPLVEALKRCGRDLTRERLIIELENMNNFKGVGPPVTFKPFEITSPECRIGARHVYLAQCIEDGKTKRLTDWIMNEK